MRFSSVVAVTVVTIATLGCADLLGKGDSEELVAEAQSLLKSGDLPAADDKLEQLAKENPDSVFVAKSRAYTKLLKGDYEGADQVLQAVEAKATPEAMGDIKLRRSLVALRAGDLDKVKELGVASATPVGKLLAAEVHLVDLEQPEAIKLLKEISGTSGEVGSTATQYLKLLESESDAQKGLAEATALWSLGDREAACKSAEDVLTELETEDKNEQLLLWAGRAVTSKQSGVATSLLDAIDAPPPGQAWRIEAIRAMVLIAEGKNKEGIGKLQALINSNGAPTDGLYDAVATAVALCQDKEAAKELAGTWESAAIARGLTEAGAPKLGAGRAPEGPLKNVLSESGGGE